MTKPKYTLGQLREALNLCDYPAGLKDEMSLGDAYDYLKKNIRSFRSSSTFNMWVADEFYALSKRQAISIAAFHIKNDIYMRIIYVLGSINLTYISEEDILKWSVLSYDPKGLIRAGKLPRNWLNRTLKKKQYEEYLKFLEEHLEIEQ